MSPESIKAILCDTFGTVMDWRTSIIADFQAFGRDHRLDVDWEAFVDEWKTAYRPGMDAVRSGESPWMRVDAIYGVKLDAIFCAEMFGHYKPDAEVYLGAVKLLGLRPADVMLVATHNYDLRSARSHGMGTGFVRRPTEYGPKQTTDLKPESDWDVICDSFTELASALGC